MPRPRGTPQAGSRLQVAFTDLIDKSVLTQTQLAARAGYYQSDISFLRLRKQRRMPLAFYEDVANALGYDLVLVKRAPKQRTSGNA